MSDPREMELRSRIEELVAATRAEREAFRRSSITGLTISLALVVIVAIFALVNYNQFETEWTEEKLSAGFQKELEVLNPSATEQLQQLGQHLLPIYAETSREQFMDMTPEIAERLREEVDKLANNLRSDAETRLTTVSGRISTHAEEVTFAAYPGLRSDAEKEHLTQNFRKVTEQAVQQTTTEFGELFTTDVHQLEKKIHGFNVEGSKDSTTDLQKRFIHLWLQLLDAEIMKR